ncbi:MAG TPA: GDSL-type esterase/lipase family protein [Gemmatimonadales bacterium]|nr:GDSL-type esterase/lipase family protein [Gemmatimonadales bacterium]
MSEPEHEWSRRGFVAAAGSAAAFAAVGRRLDPQAAVTSDTPGPGRVILFQGDSITDCGRDRDVTAANSAAALGNGYPLLIAAARLAAHPGRGYRFFDRGVSGNTVPDLDARWQADTLDLEPDVLSILIGVNDYWHTLGGDYHGTVDDYARGYAALLARTRRALPKVRFVVLEPFVLRTGVVKDSWFPEFDQRREAARRVAREADATFLPLQKMFDELSREAPPVYWSLDGVHPTAAGHAAIADLWTRKVKL